MLAVAAALGGRANDFRVVFKDFVWFKTLLDLIPTKHEATLLHLLSHKMNFVVEPELSRKISLPTILLFFFCCFYPPRTYVP